MPKRRIFIATPAYDEPCTDYTKSLISTMELFGRADLEVHVGIVGGLCYVHVARNHLVDSFLRSPCDEMIFIDSDIGWNPEELLQLCCIERNVIGGVAPYRSNDVGFPIVVKKDSEGFYTGSYIEGTDSALLECEVVPTAMLRIQRGVFGKLVEANEVVKVLDSGKDRYNPSKIYRFFNFETEEKKNELGEPYIVEYGEDVTFCHKCTRAGVSIWCDPRMTLRHHGRQFFQGCLDTELKRGRENAEREASATRKVNGADPALQPVA